MKRFLKIFFISTASLLFLVFVATGILFWYAFTPEKLTPIVRKQAEKYIPYETLIGEVELTVFSTFPRFGVRVSDISIISPLADAPSDTLLKAGEVIGVVDAKAFWKEREIVVNKFMLTNSSINIFTDSTGHSNYKLFMTSDAPAEVTRVEPIYLDLKDIQFNNLDLFYTDLAAEMNAVVSGLSAGLSGTFSGDNINGRIGMGNSSISFEYKGEKYLDKALIQADIPAEVILSRQMVRLNGAQISVNDLGLSLSGTIENDTLEGNIITDLRYRSDPWLVEEVLALTPPSFLSYLGEIEASGIISSEGTIKGVAGATLLPEIDIDVELTGGRLDYGYIPFPLSELNGEMSFFWNMNSLDESHLKIDRLEGVTPQSLINTRGEVDRLFADMHYDLTTNMDANIDEIMAFFPPGMDIDITGKIKGEFFTDFTLSQAIAFELDKMKMSGSGDLSDFSFVYDSLLLSSETGKINFSLPNPSPSRENTKFAFASISSDKLTASNNAKFATYMKNTHLHMQVSDLRDTTSVPDMLCRFSIDTFWAGNDTMSFDIDKPYGYFSVSSAPGFPKRPAIELAYTSYETSARMGASSATVESIALNTDILNDNTEEDIFLQWLANGFVEMEKGSFNLSGLPNPVYIPSIKMDFDPETFNILESSVIFEESDFGLSGTWDNVYSYFRGDSLLRGDFKFSSANTDLARLMSLTSGIGAEEPLKEEAIDSDDSYRHFKNETTSFGNNHSTLSGSEPPSPLQHDDHSSLSRSELPSPLQRDDHSSLSRSELPSPLQHDDHSSLSRSEPPSPLKHDDHSLLSRSEPPLPLKHDNHPLPGDAIFEISQPKVQPQGNNTTIYSKGNYTSSVSSGKETPSSSGGNYTSPSLRDNHASSDSNRNVTSFTGPYMVPQGIDVLLRANVDSAIIGTDTISNIIGNVRISDGILVLDGLTLKTPAADMQLTAMYRTPRKNHLYLGIDYHMLDVEISRLLEMIPDIDTLMPMLRSFKGRGEFHFAVETYLDSLYNMKMSTLRGASSITGQDLVLMDGETFSEIAKSLRFSKKAENRVDSLSAEFTIFREEIDVYPFLIVMDRYKAVVGGRHNLDMSFDYHISLVESPLPLRLGIDVNGNLKQLQYRLTRPRYAEFYRPVSRRAVESHQLEIRQMIRETLTRSLIQTE